MNQKEKKSNLHIWNQVNVTNPDWLKDGKVNGVNIKAINPQKQLQQATELFGPYGTTWGLRNCKRSFIDMQNGTKLIFLECEFFYPDGCFEISNSLEIGYMTTGSNKYYKVDSEAPKKVETNTISKALSKLGFSSDVFEGNFDKVGYKEMVSYLQGLDQVEIDAAKKLIKEAKTVVNITALWNKKKHWQGNPELLEFYKCELQTLQQITD